jgi:hypothetical protein
MELEKCKLSHLFMGCFVKCLADYMVVAWIILDVFLVGD